MLLFLLAGCVRTDLAALHPSFRPHVEAVMARLAAEGHPARIVTTWRDPRRQDLLFDLGRLAERVGRSPGTLARGGESCHNQVLRDDAASAAVDLRPAEDLDHAGQVAFFRALGRAAKARGLRWGGDWRRRDPRWADDGLGWDPGHVEDARLCGKLRGG